MQCSEDLQRIARPESRALTGEGYAQIDLTKHSLTDIQLVSIFMNAITIMLPTNWLGFTSKLL